MRRRGHAAEIGRDPATITRSIHLPTAINAFDLLSEHAVREGRAGKTTSLRDFLAGEIDEPDGDAE